MSKYTTGELAKLCGISIRTVQYYDSRDILIPSELSEGGRRLYSEEDLQKMKIICFLRDAGISLGNIGSLLSEEDPGSIISILLDQQEQILQEELNERQKKLAMVENIKKELKNIEHFSVESIGDIAHIMENKKKIRKVRAVMLVFGLIAECIEIAYLFFGFFKGIWWPFVVGLPIVIGLSVGLVLYYYRKVDYICPKCHSIFKPRFGEMLFAKHTMTTRKLTCTCCEHKGFCVETYTQVKKTEDEE